jgi:pimeloyl-ACP methyl ester carboxylesterase
VETHGEEAGLAVILLHHGLGTVRAWRAQTPALVASGFRVIAYDRWGYGSSDGRLSLTIPSFRDDLEDLSALCAALGISQAALIGHSDGGTLALYFAAQYPERIARLAAVSAHVYVEPKMKDGIQAVHRDFETDERFREGLRRAHGEKFEAVFRSWHSGWMRPENLGWDMRPILSRIDCPTLIVQGVDDEHATPQHARDLAGCIPQAELWLEPGAAHMLPQERPEDFNRRVIEFLKRDA